MGTWVDEENATEFDYLLFLYIQVLYVLKSHIKLKSGCCIINAVN